MQVEKKNLHNVSSYSKFYSIFYHAFCRQTVYQDQHWTRSSVLFLFFLVKDKSSNIIFGTMIDTMNAWRKNMFWFAILKGH